MTNFALEWDIGSDDAAGAAHRIASGAAHCARQYVAHEFPDLAEMFPFERQFRAEAEKSSDGWIAVRAQWEPGMQIPMVGGFSNSVDLQHLSMAAAKFLPAFGNWSTRPSGEIMRMLGDGWFGFDRFTYFGPIEGRRVSWPDVQVQVIEWLIAFVIPKVEDLNRQRVVRAIPQPPMFDLAKIFSALWILEADSDCTQGTAFALEGVGLVTCDHALRADTTAFRYDQVGKHFPVNVLKRNATLDLAVLSFTGAEKGMLQRGQADQLRQMDHILVAGHPNYRLGDSPISVPGLVVGFRPVSGVRRLITNAPIVAGTSGGPVIDGSGKVIGVARTGSKTFSTAQTTEDHGIVPIDALVFL